MTTKESIVASLAILAVAILMFCAGYQTRDLKANEAKLNTCTADHLCPNAVEALERLRDYQLDVYQDSTIIFDGDRKVSVLRFDSTQALDSVIMDDNQ